MSLLDPTRPSRPGPAKPPSPARTQRIRPSCTAPANHLTLTSDSRPEKPPSPATFAPELMIVPDAPVWLERPIVPPPCAATYCSACVVDWPPKGPPGPPNPPPGPPPGPPGPPANERVAGPPAGKVPLVAWPSVWTDHVAGAIMSTPSAPASA